MAAKQEAAQLKTQLSEINSSLKSTSEQLDKEKSAGTPSCCAVNPVECGHLCLLLVEE